MSDSSLSGAIADADKLMDKLNNLVVKYSRDDPAMNPDDFDPSSSSVEKKINVALALADSLVIDIRRL